jgi:peptidoglycan hydrolase-like protein with peptidoglycan-binding domain
MSGQDVFALQEGLIYAGYFDRLPDGKFGENTKTAVINYQKASKLKADGIAGENTQRKLLGDPAVASSMTAGAQTSQPETTTVAADNGVLKLGSKGDLVRQVQTQLQALGYLSSKADGSFGVNTELAVIAFQRASKLKADGAVGSATQNALTSAVAKAGSGGASSGGTASASGPLKEGSKGDSVKQMQTALRELGYYAGSLTGNFGSLTGEAVRAFQKANSLTSDGIAGSTTLNKLYSGSALAKGGKTGTVSAPAAAGNTPSAARVQNVNWYTLRGKYKAGTIVTIYDFHTGLTWRCRFMSLGKHADSEPCTSADTDTMYTAFGKKNTWNPKSVWVTMPDGSVYIASMHNTPHLSGTVKDNNFPGHLCIHFPREKAEAEATGPYAVSHQEEIAKGWAETQRMAGR